MQNHLFRLLNYETVRHQGISMKDGEEIVFAEYQKKEWFYVAYYGRIICVLCRTDGNSCKVRN